MNRVVISHLHFVGYALDGSWVRLAGRTSSAAARCIVYPPHREDTLMEVAIPKSLEALVRRKVEEGHYSNEHEVVADALRLI
jgi:hypothetical protein